LSEIWENTSDEGNIGKEKKSRIIDKYWVKGGEITVKTVRLVIVKKHLNSQYF